MPAWLRVTTKRNGVDLIVIYFKACPKCHGDIEFITETQEYKALQCMQCGFTVDNQKGKVVILTNKS
jgi:uncharacterized Zn finger protein